MKPTLRFNVVSFFGLVVVLPGSKDNCIHHIPCDCEKRNYHGRNYLCILLYGKLTTWIDVSPKPSGWLSKIGKRTLFFKKVYKMVSFFMENKRENYRDSFSRKSILVALFFLVEMSCRVVRHTAKRIVIRRAAKCILTQQTVKCIFTLQSIFSRDSHATNCEVHCHATHYKLHSHVTLYGTRHCKVHFHAIQCWHFGNSLQRFGSEMEWNRYDLFFHPMLNQAIIFPLMCPCIL